MKQLKDRQGNILEFLLNGDIESDDGYIKFSNGILICYGKRELSVSFTKAYNNYRMTIRNPFTFAKEYIESPVVICATANDGDYAFSSVIGTLRDKTKISSITLFRDVEVFDSSVVTVQYIAIGRWK